MSSESRKFLASAALLLVLVLLVGYLTFIPVPSSNKDVIISILGVLVGAGAAAVPNLVGDPKSETKALQYQVNSLQAELDVVKAQYLTVKESYDRITDMLIKRHVVDADGIEVKQ